MDYLELEWYNKLTSIGMPSDEAQLMARLKAAIERDRGLLDRIKRDGFEGFVRWIEIKCKDIYYAIRSAIEGVWEWFKRLF